MRIMLKYIFIVIIITISCNAYGYQDCKEYGLASSELCEDKYLEYLWGKKTSQVKYKIEEMQGVIKNALINEDYYLLDPYLQYPFNSIQKILMMM